MVMAEEIAPERRSLEEVHGSIAVPSADGKKPGLRQFLAFLGPAYLVSVGYMDPGNWATDLAGGAEFGYALIWVLLMSNLMAILLQTLAARLGVVTGHDLAQACRAEYSPKINAILWVLAEVAIAATDLAEVLGTIIALKLLFNLPLLWGCLVTAFDTFLLLYLQRWGMRQVEAVILALVATIGACFLIQIFMARPDMAGIVSGLRPTMPDGALYVAIGILGATVMPHNLYLHSALVQTRRIGSDRRSKAMACRYYLLDSTIALNLAFFVNMAILVVSAAVFFRHGVKVASIEKAYELLPSFLGQAAPILFGIALLCAGQSSTLTGTLAGQIVMEGYLHLRIAPWLRRLITRLLALIPAVLVISLAGEQFDGRPDHPEPGDLEPPALVRRDPPDPLHVESAEHGHLCHAVVGACPGLDDRRGHRRAQRQAGRRSDQPVDRPGDGIREIHRADPIKLAGGSGSVRACTSAVGALLVWVTIKPIVRRSPPWLPKPAVKLDWMAALRPRTLSRIGVALEHDLADTEILNRALGLAQTQASPSELVLLHVVDTPVTRVLGAETADRETGADERYLADLVAALRDRGYSARSVLLYGPDPAGELVTYLRHDPVDLLVVGSHGHGMVRDLLLGQTVDRVRHSLEVPMLIARPDRDVAVSGQPATSGQPPDDADPTGRPETDIERARPLESLR